MEATFRQCRGLVELIADQDPSREMIEAIRRSGLLPEIFRASPEDISELSLFKLGLALGTVKFLGDMEYALWCSRRSPMFTGDWITNLMGIGIVRVEPDDLVALNSFTWEWDGPPTGRGLYLRAPKGRRAADDLDRFGLRPATLAEFCTLGGALPRIHIAITGSKVFDKGLDCVPVIGPSHFNGVNDVMTLRISNIGHVENMGYWLAAVKK